MISPMTARKGINIVDGFHPQISASVCYTFQICTPQVLEIRKAGLQLSKRKNRRGEKWQNGKGEMAKWENGKMERGKWQNGRMAKWKGGNGKMERGKWQNGRMAK
ncbi:Plasmodium exported protein, unknown function [Plasmodium ovale curtisi]|uniref:Uncharacterized protein n=1 Tax=Plasmodium ovale curtisi TaxID=864141 RepID=A0A1A8VK91_PLAOA|nr:Plasmodium exported protein, unknown function [Plasmodium ovale curtisi]